MKNFLIIVFIINHILSFGQIVDYYKEEKNFSDVGELKYYKGSPFTGQIASYYDNGKFKSKSTFKNGKLDGAFYLYYENGDYKRISNFVDGLDHGEYKLFYHNGMPELIGQHVNGKAVGIWEHFHENGMISIRCEKSENCNEWFNFINKYQEFHKNGKVKTIGYYDENCKKSGQWIDYDEFGNMKLRRIFKNGLLNGVTERYMIDGFILKQYYINSELIKEEVIKQ